MMTSLLHISAKILLIIWGIGFFLFGIGVFIHVLLFLAILSLVSRYFISYKLTEKGTKLKRNKLSKQ